MIFGLNNFYMGRPSFGCGFSPYTNNFSLPPTSIYSSPSFTAAPAFYPACQPAMIDSMFYFMQGFQFVKNIYNLQNPNRSANQISANPAVNPFAVQQPAWNNSWTPDYLQNQGYVPQTPQWNSYANGEIYRPRPLSEYYGAAPQGMSSSPTVQNPQSLPVTQQDENVEDYNDDDSVYNDEYTIKDRIKTTKTNENLIETAKKVNGKVRDGKGGWCYQGTAKIILDTMNFQLRGDHAYQAANQLAKSDKFKEIKVPVDQLKNLPAGAIIVWNQGRGKNAEDAKDENEISEKSGHIGISDGKGGEYSDVYRKQKDPKGIPFRVFVSADNEVDDSILEKNPPVWADPEGDKKRELQGKSQPKQPPTPLSLDSYNKEKAVKLSNIAKSYVENPANNGGNSQTGPIAISTVVKFINDAMGTKVKPEAGSDIAIQMEKSGKFQEVSVSQEQLKSLPAGAIVVFEEGGSGNGVSKTHGDIVIADGKGGEYSEIHSDKIRDKSTAKFRVFLPI